jgi:hypothetical protein
MPVSALMMPAAVVFPAPIPPLMTILRAMVRR